MIGLPEAAAGPGDDRNLAVEQSHCILSLLYQRHSGMRLLAQPRNNDCECVHPSTVLPLLITVTSRAFTLASKEITLPSFQMSMVTVSPG
jgi:hypothetical protein